MPGQRGDARQLRSASHPVAVKWSSRDKRSGDGDEVVVILLVFLTFPKVLAAYRYPIVTVLLIDRGIFHVYC